MSYNTTMNSITAVQYVFALPELIHEIFLCLEGSLGEASIPGPGHLLSCARVNHYWNSIATPIIWYNLPMLSYAFTDCVKRKSPNRQALANCVRYAVYNTRQEGPDYADFKSHIFRLSVAKRWLKGLEFSRLHTLTIQIYTGHCTHWQDSPEAGFYTHCCVDDMHLLPLITCPALSRLILWHKDRCAVQALPKIWMRYIRSILVSPAQSCCSF